MEELLFFIFGMIAEALGLKAKKPSGPPAPLSPNPPRRPMPGTAPPAPNNGGARTGTPARPPLFMRRPDAGGPAVPREATTGDFAAQEQALLLSQTLQQVQDVRQAAAIQPPPKTMPALFSGPDDLVRAVILQEVLGPPLSRRKPH